jgi:hypothetical protein
VRPGSAAIWTNQGIHTCSSLNVFTHPSFSGVERREHSVVKVHHHYIAQVFCLQWIPPAKRRAAIPMAKARGPAPLNREGHVHLAGQRHTALCGNSLGLTLGGGAVEIGDTHGQPVGGKSFGDRSADAARRAGDNTHPLGHAKITETVPIDGNSAVNVSPA